MRFFCVSVCMATISVSCTFVYTDPLENTVVYPDITMENMEYVRVENGTLTARLSAEVGERYEKKHLMNLKNYQFEQYNTSVEEIDAQGNGGAAVIEMNNNNIKMTEGVVIQVDSEDFTMETLNLNWEDKTRVLQGDENSPVQLRRKNGTEVNGQGFHADVRARTWVLGSNVHGVYVDDEDEEKEGEQQNVPVEGAAQPATSTAQAQSSTQAVPAQTQPPGQISPPAAEPLGQVKISEPATEEQAVPADTAVQIPAPASLDTP
ncbi:MAG: LPS export ABC transporter periplasmic protein LptC [Spirochaetaceae bacterium]|jgi:LPS export ABC transporter protein LptC|nr:LPS export ABC transporter periplasmic protein LptC [Spirochaetaceae bacterium]